MTLTVAIVSAPITASVVNETINVAVAPPEIDVSLVNDILNVEINPSSMSVDITNATTEVEVVTQAVNVVLGGVGPQGIPGPPGPSGGGGYQWQEVLSPSVQMAVDNAYIANNASLVTLTLPTVAALGEGFIITGKGAGGWKIAQNAGQSIHFASQSSTQGTAGSISSQDTFDCVQLVCITANYDFLVISSIGNITGV